MSEALNFIYNALDAFSGKETPEEAMAGLVDLMARGREKAQRQDDKEGEDEYNND